MGFKWLRRLLCLNESSALTTESVHTVATFSNSIDPNRGTVESSENQETSSAISPTGTVGSTGNPTKQRKEVHFGAPNSIIQISRNSSYLITPPKGYRPHDAQPIHFNVRPPSECFCGREETLEKLHQFVEDSKREGEFITVLCHSLLHDFNHLGGIGTTETIRAYVDIYAMDYYRNIVWIDAENSITIKNCFMRLAENNLKMYLLDETGKYYNFTKIIQDIYDQLCTEPTLLMFDNTKSLESSDESYVGIQNFLPLNLNPRCVPPVVLIASKNTNWTQRMFLLESLTNEDCIHILCKNLGIVGDQRSAADYVDALNLSEICGKLPLALQLALSIMKNTENFGMHDLLELYEEGLHKYLQHRPSNSSVDASVFVMTNIIFGKIIEHNQGQLALQIMEYLAYLSPVIIPKDLVLSMFSKTEGAMNKAIHILHKYSLLVDCKTYVQIHRMIQQATVETLRANDLEINALGMSVHAVQKFLLNKDPNSECFREGLACAMHLENSLKTYAVPEYLNFAKFVASKLEDVHFEESYELFNKILIFEKETLPPNHPRILETQNHIATVLRNLNKFEESLELYLAIFNESTESLGIDHPLTLSIKHNIATIFAKQDLDGDALKIFAEVLERRKSLFGTNNHETLDTQSNLAAVLNKQGERTKAIELFSEALAGKAKLLGPNHPDTLRTQNELAATLFVQGSTEEAAKIHAHVLDAATRCFGTTHPLTLMTQGHLAAAYFMQNKFVEAIDLFSAILISQQKLRTFDDSTILTVQNNMAMACVKVGNNSRALELYSEALFVATDKLGTDHPLVIATESNLASLHFNMGEMNSALLMYSDVLERRKETLGIEHPLTKATQLKITSVLESMHNSKNNNMIISDNISYEQPFSNNNDCLHQ